MANPAAPIMATPISFSNLLDTTNLKNRSVLITGAASGIGLACTIKMAEAGAIVTIADLQDTAGAVIQDLTARGLQAQFVQCDVTSYEAQASMFQSAIQFGKGQIDVVIPNAGILAKRMSSTWSDLPTIKPIKLRPPAWLGLTIWSSIA